MASVGAASRLRRSSTMMRNISQTSFMLSKWSRRSPSRCVTRTMPQPCRSRRLVLTLERATPSVEAISSALSGRGERNSNAWIWATVRLMPQRVPISPQWRMNFCWTGDRYFIGFCLFRNYRIARICQGRAPRSIHRGPSLEGVDDLFHQVGGQGVGGDAARPGDVEADRFAFEIHERSAALPGLKHRVMLKGAGKSFRPGAQSAPQSIHAFRTVQSSPQTVGIGGHH